MANYHESNIPWDCCVYGHPKILFRRTDDALFVTHIILHVTSVCASDLQEEMPALIKVCMTFTLLMSTISQDYTQTSRQATYYAAVLARDNAFAEWNVGTVKSFSHSCNIFSKSARKARAQERKSRYNPGPGPHQLGHVSERSRGHFPWQTQK